MTCLRNLGPTVKFSPEISLQAAVFWSSCQKCPKRSVKHLERGEKTDKQENEGDCLGIQPKIPVFKQTASPASATMNTGKPKNLLALSNSEWKTQSTGKRWGPGSWTCPVQFRYPNAAGSSVSQLAFEDGRKASLINLLTFYHRCEPLGPWKPPQLDQTSSPRPSYLNPFSFHNENDLEKTRENPKQSTGHFPGTLSSVCYFASSIHMQCHFVVCFPFQVPTK